MNLVSILHAKERAKTLPLDFSLRALILQEPDFVPESEFETKSKVWLQLLEIELLKNKDLGASVEALNASTESLFSPEIDNNAKHSSG